MRESGSSFQELADEAFADLLKKRKQPIGLRAALKESVGTRSKRVSHHLKLGMLANPP